MRHTSPCHGGQAKPSGFIYVSEVMCRGNKTIVRLDLLFCDLMPFYTLDIGDLGVSDGVEAEGVFFSAPKLMCDRPAKKTK